MKVHVPKKRLADSLSQVERIIPARSSNPGLHLLRIVLSENTVTLSGSSMDIDIQASFPAEVQGEGDVALPAHVLSQVVKALPGEFVELRFSDSEIDISSSSYDTKLRLEDPEAAPLLEFPEHYSGTLPAGLIAKALGHVRYAAAIAEYQAVFRGVKLELSDKRTRAIATDGFRLAYYDIEDPSGLDQELIIPARSVDEITKIVSDGEVQLSVADGQLSLANGAYKLNVKLMEGSFPDYQRVIPSQFPVSISLESSQLSDAVKRVAVVADQTANNRVDFFIKDGTLQITSEGSYGNAQETIEVFQEGQDSEIALAYNAKYLVDAINPISGRIRLSFSGPTSPSVMVSDEDPNYLAMVVPLRTG